MTDGQSLSSEQLAAMETEAERQRESLVVIDGTINSLWEQIGFAQGQGNEKAVERLTRSLERVQQQKYRIQTDAGEA